MIMPTIDQMRIVPKTGNIVAPTNVSVDPTAMSGSGSNPNASPYVLKSGDTMSGVLMLAGNPSRPLDAVTKQYVDHLTSGGNMPTDGFLSLSGGTMTGPLLLSAAPTTDMEAASKAYVDATSGVFSSGVQVFTFDVNFIGTDPATFDDVPTGWTVTAPSSGIVHVMHSVGAPPKMITGFGLSGDGHTWRQALFGGNTMYLTYNDSIPDAFDICGMNTTFLNVVAPGNLARIYIMF